MILLCGANETSTRARARVVVLLSGRYVIAAQCTSTVVVVVVVVVSRSRCGGEKGPGGSLQLASLLQLMQQQRCPGGWQ